MVGLPSWMKAQPVELRSHSHGENDVSNLMPYSLQSLQRHPPPKVNSEPQTCLWVSHILNYSFVIVLCLNCIMVSQNIQYT